jgi:hypothetical protein
MYDLQRVLYELGLRPAGLVNKIGTLEYVQVECSVCEVWLHVKNFSTDIFPDIWLATQMQIRPRDGDLWQLYPLLSYETLRSCYDEWCEGNLDLAVMRSVFQ